GPEPLVDEGLRRVVLPPRLAHVPVREDETAAVRQEARPEVDRGVDAAGPRDVDVVGAVCILDGVAGGVDFVAQRPPGGVVERVRALDQADPGPVLLDDLLGGGALRLQGLEPSARRGQLRLDRLHLAAGGRGQARGQLLLPPPRLLDALLERAALFLLPLPLLFHALLERAPLLVAG